MMSQRTYFLLLAFLLVIVFRMVSLILHIHIMEKNYTLQFYVQIILVIFYHIQLKTYSSTLDNEIIFSLHAHAPLRVL